VSEVLCFFDKICKDSDLRRRERRGGSSGEASGSERSEGDRKGRRGESLRAKISRRSNPFIRTKELNLSGCLKEQVAYMSLFIENTFSEIQV